MRLPGQCAAISRLAGIALEQCFPEASVVTDSAWNEFNHQQVFAQYEPYNEPHLLKG